MQQNTLNFKRLGFLAKGSIYLISNIFNHYAKGNQTRTKITEKFIASVDYNICRLDFMQFPALIIVYSRSKDNQKLSCLHRSDVLILQQSCR